jgi:Tfp pilus assembly protein PilF
MIKIARGKISEGIQDLEKSVSLRPQYEQAQLSLAHYLAGQGRLLEAKEHYQYVLDHLSAQNQLAQDSLAIIEASLSGKTQRAN